MGIISVPSPSLPPKRLQGQNTLVKIGLIELAEPSDLSDLYIYCLYLCGIRSFVLAWVDIHCYSIYVMCFWCYFLLGYRELGIY